MKWSGTDMRKMLPMSIAMLVLPMGSALAASRIAVRHLGAGKERSGVEYGTASWYGPGFQGRRMATGERFNEDALTAAHRTLPLGTTVRVTNLLNGRSVLVAIMDRGPMIATRLIDLSREAAVELGFIERGLTRVKIEIVRLPSAVPHRILPSPSVAYAQLHTASAQ